MSKERERPRCCCNGNKQICGLYGSRSATATTNTAIAISGRTATLGKRIIFIVIARLCSKREKKGDECQSSVPFKRLFGVNNLRTSQPVSQSDELRVEITEIEQPANLQLLLLLSPRGSNMLIKEKSCSKHTCQLKIRMKKKKVGAKKCSTRLPVKRTLLSVWLSV